MTTINHLARLKEGVEVWNEWRKKNVTTVVSFRGSELTKASLSGVMLNKADLFQANLSKSDLIRADLREAKLTCTDLRGTKLNNADLRGAKLTEADLRGAKLNGADLRGADLRRAKLFRTDLTGADLADADFTEADLTKAILANANLRGANLTEVDLVRTDFTNAILANCRVYGISAWNVKLEGASQQNLIITPKGESSITVDDLEVAQFIYLLINNQKIRNVIHTITSKAVLILGRFYEARKEVLDAIRTKLTTMNYVPIIFDFTPSENRNLTETVQLLAGMSRFVIADITDPSSVPQELTVIIRSFNSVPVKPIILKEIDEFSKTGQLKRPYAMFQDWVDERHVLDLFRYKDKEHIVESLEEEVLREVEAWFNRESPEDIEQRIKIETLCVDAGMPAEKIAEIVNQPLDIVQDIIAAIG